MASGSGSRSRKTDGGRPRGPLKNRGVHIHDLEEDINEGYYVGADDSSSPNTPPFRRVPNRRQLQEIQEEEDRQYAASLHHELNRGVGDYEVHAEDVDDEMDEEGDGGLGADERQEKPMPKRERKPRSNVFTVYFKKVEMKDPKTGKNCTRAVCNLCGKDYAFQQGAGYGTYQKHIKKHHDSTAGKGKGIQTQLDPKVGESGTPELGLFKYNDVIAREVMAKFVATQSLAFQFADSLHYEDSIKQAYNPLAKRITRSTMTRTIVRLAHRYKIMLRNMLTKLPHRVSVCCDIWTCAYQKNSYMGITVHWVDQTWILNKRVLCFKKFNCAHTSENIALIILKILQQFRITEKIFSIGFDNASSNTASVPSLIAACNPTLEGKYFHTRCICHILNLCVQDGLRVLDNQIKPIRRAVEMLRDKQKLHKKWLKFCKAKTGRTKSFNIDVCTRWNSTYDMLQSTSEFKELLVEFFTIEVNSLILLTSYWDECQDIIKLLEVFQAATKDLSGVYYPTSPRVLYHCVLIAAQFNVCSQKPNLTSITNVMVLKWVKYFQHIPQVFLVAKCLDPQLKYVGVCGLLDLYYKFLNEMTFDTYNSGVSLESLALPDVGQVRDTLWLSLQNLFKDYTSKYGENISRKNVSSQHYSLGIDTSHHAGQLIQDFFTNAGGYGGMGRGRAEYTELDDYLNEAKGVEVQNAGPNQVDVLQWWSMKQVQFPILAIMAKEIFSVPASTVAVEQAFSQGGYMLDERRSVMTPANLEAQLLLKDHVLAEAREQENKWDELFAEYPMSTTEAESSDASESSQADDDFDDDFDFDM